MDCLDLLEQRVLWACVVKRVKKERMDSPEFLESLPSLASQDLKVMLGQKESLDLME